MDVPSFLGMVKGLLADVPGELLSVDPRLFVTKVPLSELVPGRTFGAPLVLALLLMVNPQLVAISGELLAVTECLLQVGQALLPG